MALDPSHSGRPQAAKDNDAPIGKVGLPIGQNRQDPNRESNERRVDQAQVVDNVVGADTPVDQPRRSKLPVPLEKIATDSFLRMKEIRNLSNSLPAMAGVVWMEVKDEIECLDKRLHQLDTTLISLQRSNTDLRIKMADERALFETLSSFESLPPRGKEIVASSYFTLVVSDLKRRMQNLVGRVNQLLNMQTPNDKTGPTSQAVLLRRVIVQNQETLRSTAAKMYSLHEKVLQLAHHLGTTALPFAHPLSDSRQSRDRTRLQGLKSNVWTYTAFPDQSFNTALGSGHSPCDLYDRSDSGPPPLEPVTGLSLFSVTDNRRLPIPGPRKEMPHRIDNERLDFVGLPDLSQLRFVKKDASGQQPIIPNYEFRPTLERSAKATARMSKKR